MYLLGDKVLVLQLKERQKLQTIWAGPFTVITCISDENYEIELNPKEG